MTGEEEEEAGERNRKGGRARGLRVVIDGRKTTNGRAMAGKEEESQRGGGGYEVCTRLSAQGVPCGPGSGVREG